MIHISEILNLKREDHSLFNYFFYLELMCYSAILIYNVIFIHTLISGWDGANMLFASESISKTGFYDGFPRAFWPPLYMILIVLLSFILQNFFLSGKIISAFSSIIFFLFCFKFFKTKLSPFYSLLGCTVLFSIKLIFSNSVSVETHLLFCAFLIISLYLFQIKEKNPYYLYFIGLFISLASLTRNTGLIFFFSILLIFFMNFIIQKSKIYLRYIKNISIGFFSVYSWYFIYNFIDKGVFFYDYNYLNFALFYNQHYKIQNYNNIFDVILKNTISSHLSHIFVNLQALMVIFYDIFGILAFLFIYSLFYLKKDKNLLELYIIALIFLIGHVFSFIQPEFLIAIYPIFILGILVTFRNLVELFRKNKANFVKLNNLILKNQINKTLRILFIMLIFFSSFCLSTIANINYDQNTEAYYNNNFNIQETADFLNKIMINNESFMTLLPIYSYYIKDQFIEINVFNVKYLFEHFFYSNLTSLEYNTLPRNPTTSNPNKITNYVIIDNLIKQNLLDLAFLYLPTNKSLIPSYLIPIKTFQFTSIYRVNQTKIKNLINSGG